jgi:hypothetical protein
MIPQTDISIDGSTAWALLTALAQYVPAGEFPETWLNHPCDTCDGFGDLKSFHLLSATTSRCRDCDGTGRHTFTLDVEDPDAAPIYIPMTKDLTVHVVEVMPIVDHLRESRRPRIQKLSAPKMSGQTHWVDDGERPGKKIQLPATAAPGKWAVRLAIHKETS